MSLASRAAPRPGSARPGCAGVTAMVASRSSRLAPVGLRPSPPRSPPRAARVASPSASAASRLQPSWLIRQQETARSARPAGSRRVMAATPSATAASRAAASGGRLFQRSSRSSRPVRSTPPCGTIRSRTSAGCRWRARSTAARVDVDQWISPKRRREDRQVARRCSCPRPAAPGSSRARAAARARRHAQLRGRRRWSRSAARGGPRYSSQSSRERWLPCACIRLTRVRLPREDPPMAIVKRRGPADDQIAWAGVSWSTSAARASFRR